MRRDVVLLPSSGKQCLKVPSSDPWVDYPALIFQPKTIHQCFHMDMGLADLDLLKRVRATKSGLYRHMKLFLTVNDKWEYRD